jgi:hypothetical protein
MRFFVSKSILQFSRQHVESEMTDSPNTPERLPNEPGLPIPKRRPPVLRWLTGKWLPPCCIEPTARWSSRCKPDGWGVYRLIALDSNGAPSQLARVCGIDPSGTLYIGRGKLRSRVGGLVRTHNPTLRQLSDPGQLQLPKLNAHSPLPRRLAKRFPPPYLAVTWLRTDSEGNAKSLERKLLRAYEQMFGEFPPMNKQ